jgi:hypothetical protein
VSRGNTPKPGGAAGRKRASAVYNPLLSRTEPESDAGAEALAETTEVAAATDGLTSLPVDTQTRPQADTPAGPAPTQKFTFYFSEEQLERLDAIWERLRRESRRSKQRVSKSLFVRVALDRLLDDFERDPERVIAELKAELAASKR